jgi:hypothetical protein
MMAEQETGTSGPKPPAAEVQDSIDRLGKAPRAEEKRLDAQLEREERAEYPIQRPSGDRARGYRKVG